MRGIEQPLVHQIADHDDGTGNSEGQSKQNTSSERPAPEVSQQQAESGDHDELDERPGNYGIADRPEVTQ